jgi:predicted HicB family RNase H-like nuclease
MRSKYSAIEIENLLDSITSKLSKSSVIQQVPKTFSYKNDSLMVYSANVIEYLCDQFVKFKMQDKESFIEFVNTIDGYSLLDDIRKAKIDKMSDKFIGVFETTYNLPDMEYGEFALILNDKFNQPNFILKSNSSLVWLNRSIQEIFLDVNESCSLEISDVKPYSMAKLYLRIVSTESTQIVEITITKKHSKNDWVIQVNNNSSFDKNLISINQYDINNNFPSVTFTSINRCSIQSRLEIII